MQFFYNVVYSSPLFVPNSIFLECNSTLIQVYKISEYNLYNKCSRIFCYRYCAKTYSSQNRGAVNLQLYSCLSVRRYCQVYIAQQLITQLLLSIKSPL